MLTYAVTKPLDIPTEAFNTDGVATIIVTGASYGGGTWVMNAISTHKDPADAEPIGSIETDPAERRPDLANTAATEWVTRECAERGLLMGPVQDLNHLYPPDEAPFFASVRFFVAIPAAQS